MTRGLSCFKQLTVPFDLFTKVCMDYDRLKERVELLEGIISRNCDPFDATKEDALVMGEIHKKLYPENY